MASKISSNFEKVFTSPIKEVWVSRGKASRKKIMVYGRMPLVQITLRQVRRNMASNEKLWEVTYLESFPTGARFIEDGAKIDSNIRTKTFTTNMLAKRFINLIMSQYNEFHPIGRSR